MKPVKFKEHNRVLTAPKGKEEEVGELPIWTNGVQCVSCWELDDAEVAEIVKNKSVWLGVMTGQTQPPVWLGVSNPFEDATDKEVDRVKIVGDIVSGDLPIKSWGLSNKLKTIIVDEIEFEYILQSIMKSGDADVTHYTKTHSELAIFTDSLGLLIVRKGL